MAYEANLIPLSSVISAALMDTYADYGQSYQSYAHWAGRRYKSLVRQSLKVGKRYATLAVNKNTHTATLPPDFKKDLFVGYLNGNNQKVALPRRYQLATTSIIENYECVDPCPKCSQSKSICDELTVTQKSETVTIQGNPYLITSIKKLYNNGNYYLEKTIPYYNTVTLTVEYTTTKEFIAEISLKECGCPETTQENIDKIRVCCPDVYGNYYTSCSSDCDTSLGGYNVLEEQGLIQLDRKFTADKLYIEYLGFLPKVNGQYAVPEVAFETIVKGVVIDALAGKRNVSLGEKQLHEMRYRVARSAMDKEMGLIGLDQIMQSISLIPKFDVSYKFRMDNGGCEAQPTLIQNTVKADTETSCNNTTGSGLLSYLAPFSLSLIVGVSTNSPIVGSFSYTNAAFIGATNLNYIVVNNNNESKDRGDFTFNSATGTITRVNPNQQDDVIIYPYAKII